MRAFVHRLLQQIIVPIAWTIITIVLLCLPGSTIPSLGTFSFEYLDKIVHFFLFGTLVFLWAYYLYLNAGSNNDFFRQLLWVTVGAILLGVVMEVVQFYLIPNRDFDRLDIVANSLGALVVASLFALRTRSQKA